jgi:hypothetical protein
MPRRKLRIPDDHPAARFEDVADELGERVDITYDGSPRGPHQSRHPALRSADLARISALLLQGASSEDISRELGLSMNTIKQDLMHLNRLWVRQIREDSEQFRAVIISKLMKLEGLALEAYAESREKTVTDHTTHPDGGVSRSVKTFHTAGDSSFLNVAKDCIKQQVAVLGLDGAERSVKAFDKDAFLDAVAEKIAEAKLAATSVPAMAQELKQVEDDASAAGCPF